MKVRPAVIILHEESVLLLRYNYAGNDVFGLPGGNPDSNETLSETLKRELLEELNIHIEVKELTFIGETINVSKYSTVLHVVFQGVIIDGVPKINSEHTTALEVVWLKVSDLNSKNLYPNIGVHIQSIQKNIYQNSYIGKIPQNWF